MTDPMTTLRQYVDAFNRGDVQGMAETFAVPASILDVLPPHTWHGATAAEDWYRDVAAAGKREGASGYAVKLGEPRHANVTGDSAYIVVPATMSFTVKGALVTQTGSTFTAALRKVAGHWRIAAWAWSKG